MRHPILFATLLALTGCENMQSPAPVPSGTPEEQRAYAICRDSVSRDIAYGGGIEGYMRNCMELRLREIRAGKR